MLVIASDHRGFKLKEKLKKWLTKQHIEFADIGPQSYDEMDSYVYYSKIAMEKMQESNEKRAILICGSGVGVCIVANRFKDVRAFVGHSKKVVKHAVTHDDANVLCLAADFTSFCSVKCYVKTFLNSTFLSGKYLKRISSIDDKK